MIPVIDLTAIWALLAKAARLIFALSVIVAAFTMSTVAVDAFAAWLTAQSEPVVDGQTIPLLAMMEWTGVFTGTGVVIGAHVAVVTLRQVYRVIGWLS